MTVTATSYTPLAHNGNGSASVFNITFQFYEIVVIHIDSSETETEWIENTHYTVTGGNGSTGSITVITTPPAIGEQLRIERRTSKDQPRDYDLDNAVLEDALQTSDDKLAMILQEIDRDNKRRPAISEANFSTSVEFPPASASKILGWNAAATELTNIDLVNVNGIALSAMSAETALASGDLVLFYDVSSGSNKVITKTNMLGSIAPLNKTDATGAPTNNDDGNDGYSFLSRWGGPSVDEVYVCIDATVGAAVWQLTTGDLAGLDTVGTAQIDANSITNAHMADAVANGNGTNWDAVVTNGVYGGTSTTNNPLGADTRFWIGQVIAYNPSWCVQTLTDIAGDKLKYIRCLDNGVWGSWALASATPIMIVQDEKASGVPGGTFTGGADQQRTLNTVVYNSIPNAVLSANKVFLGPGTYEFHGRAPAHRVDEHAAFIRRDDDAKWFGRSMRSYSAIYNPTVSEVNCVAQDTVSRSYDLMHRCSATYATDGFGWDHAFGFSTVYSMLTIRKLA